jgi:hypothetical protein
VSKDFLDVGILGFDELEQQMLDVNIIMSASHAQTCGAFERLAACIV